MKYYDPNKLINHWWSGCWAGLAQSIIISPVEMIKTQMQIQGVGKQVGAEYRGWRATCKHIFRHAGPQGFLKGIMCCIVRDVPSFGAYFITYEALIGRPNMLNYTGTYSSTDLPKVLVCWQFILICKSIFQVCRRFGRRQLMGDHVPGRCGEDAHSSAAVGSTTNI